MSVIEEETHSLCRLTDRYQQILQWLCNSLKKHRSCQVYGHSVEVMRQTSMWILYLTPFQVAVEGVVEGAVQDATDTTETNLQMSS
jgi:hypothetical protein